MKKQHFLRIATISRSTFIFDAGIDVYEFKFLVHVVLDMGYSNACTYVFNNRFSEHLKMLFLLDVSFLSRTIS